MLNKKALVQFIKFGIVGFSNTILSYTLYSICVLLGVHYQLANVIGFVAGVLNSFYWSNKYVFTKSVNEQRNALFVLLKTFIAYGSTGLVLNSLLLYVFIERLGIPDLIAQLIGLTITVPLNFVLNKYCSFKSKKK